MRGKVFRLAALLPLFLLFSCDKEQKQGGEMVTLPPYTSNVKTGLRTVFIYTDEPISSKETWVSPARMAIHDDDGKIYYKTEELSVKGRGNTTWTLYPKKPYALKLPEKEDLLGKGKSKRYVLLANYIDRTNLRNDVTYELSRRSSLSWTPSGEFVELYLNGQHKGLYWLGEQVKVEKVRLSADWLLEFDTNYDATWRFRTEYGTNELFWTGLPCNVKYPDEEDINDESFLQIQDMVGKVEKAICMDGDYASLIDLQSWADWFLLQELSGNTEPNHPRSCYFHFKDGVMYAGPAWDFDWSTYRSTYRPFAIGNALYYGDLLKKPDFQAMVKQRWAALKPEFSTIDSYIDAKAEEIRLSDAVNSKMWPFVINYNGDNHLSFIQAVDLMKSNIKAHIKALDAKVAAL